MDAAVAGVVAATVDAEVAVDLWVVLDGLTTGFVVENVVVTLEPIGRNDVTVAYVLVAVGVLIIVSWPVVCGTPLEAAVELGTVNWTVGLAVWGFGFWTVADGGLYELLGGFTDGLTVENVVEGAVAGLLGWPTVVGVDEYDDDPMELDEGLVAN